MSCVMRKGTKRNFFLKLRFGWIIFYEHSRNWDRKSLGEILHQNWAMAFWMWDSQRGYPGIKGKIAAVKQVVFGKNKADSQNTTTGIKLNVLVYMRCNFFFVAVTTRTARVCSRASRGEIMHRNFDCSFLSRWLGCIGSLFSRRGTNVSLRFLFYLIWRRQPHWNSTNQCLNPTVHCTRAENGNWSYNWYSHW